MKAAYLAVAAVLLSAPAFAAGLPVSDPNMTVLTNGSFYRITKDTEGGKWYDVFYNVTFEFSRIPGECTISFPLPATPRAVYRDGGMFGSIPGTWFSLSGNAVPSPISYDNNRVLIQDCTSDWVDPIPGESPKTVKIVARYLAE